MFIYLGMWHNQDLLDEVIDSDIDAFSREEVCKNLRVVDYLTELEADKKYLCIRTIYCRMELPASENFILNGRDAIKALISSKISKEDYQDIINDYGSVRAYILQAW